MKLHKCSFSFVLHKLERQKGALFHYEYSWGVGGGNQKQLTSHTSKYQMHSNYIEVDGVHLLLVSE